MNKPKWCPVDIWDKSETVSKWAEDLYVENLTRDEKQEVVEAIAAAILAERERCAAAVLADPPAED